MPPATESARNIPTLKSAQRQELGFLTDDGHCSHAGDEQHGHHQKRERRSGRERGGEGLGQPVFRRVAEQTPSVAMAFSLAGSLVISATVSRQSKPMARPSGSMNCPNRARKLVFRSPSGR